MHAERLNSHQEALETSGIFPRYGHHSLLSDVPLTHIPLNLLVNDLPSFHLLFQNRNQLEIWKRALLDVHKPEPPLRSPQEYEPEFSGTEEDDYAKAAKTVSSTSSSQGVSRSVRTAPTDYAPSIRTAHEQYMPPSMHVPWHIDIVIVIPISSPMQGLKISLLRDTLRFLVQNLGERDRMGLVTFGSSGGGGWCITRGNDNEGMDRLEQKLLHPFVPLAKKVSAQIWWKVSMLQWTCSCKEKLQIRFPQFYSHARLSRRSDPCTS